MSKVIAEKNTILRVLVGSQAYGLSVDDGALSDRDEKGVCLEPLEAHIGFDNFEQYEYRSATERTGKKDAKSEPGDLDLTIYSLKKFLRLALKGNPTIIEMFFIKDKLAGSNALGARLQELYPHIVSRLAGKAYLGYMQQQREKMLNKEPEEGSARFELVTKFGYDTKFAMHLLRLGYQGVELLETGKLVLPIIGSIQQLLMSVRAGAFNLGVVLQHSMALENGIKYLLDSSAVRETPDVDLVNDWMIKTYWQWWKAQRLFDDRQPIIDEATLQTSMVKP